MPAAARVLDDVVQARCAGGCCPTAGRTPRGRASAAAISDGEAADRPGAGDRGRCRRPAWRSISLSDDSRPKATRMASSSAIGTVTSRNAGQDVREQRAGSGHSGTPRFTTISTSLRMRTIEQDGSEDRQARARTARRARGGCSGRESFTRVEECVVNRREGCKRMRRDRRGERPRWVYGINAVAAAPGGAPGIDSPASRCDRISRRRSAQAPHRRRARGRHRGPRRRRRRPLRQLTGSTVIRVSRALADSVSSISDLPYCAATRRRRRCWCSTRFRIRTTSALLIRTAAAVEHGRGRHSTPRRRRRSPGASRRSPPARSTTCRSAGPATCIAVCSILRELRVLERRPLAARRRPEPVHAWSCPTVRRPGPGRRDRAAPLVERSCDLRASIPLAAGVESLNASVAGAVAMYEVARRSGWPLTALAGVWLVGSTFRARRRCVSMVNRSSVQMPA